ncbi:MAG: DUF421 domain-containing protein [Myxococcales bacterium]|nr:DUF421 domain-containing protein [Myxococcales bacterium]
MSWIWTNWEDVGIALARCVLAYAAVMALTRAAGLRSFAKMSTPDFVTTLAIASVAASVIVSLKMSLIAGLIALAALYGFQWFTALMAARDAGADLLNNKPLLLMAGGEFIDENMKRSHCSTSEVYSKLREANVRHLDQVLAVVFETTGDISVLHVDDDDDVEYDPVVFDGVQGREALHHLGERFQPRDA